MMRIADIVFCSSADSTPQRGMCANGILTALQPPTLPGQISFAVIVTFLGLAPDRPHRIRVELASETETVANVEGPMPQPDDRTNLPTEYKGLNLKMDWNRVRFNSPGEYTLSVAVDGTVLGEKKIFVMAQHSA